MRLGDGRIGPIAAGDGQVLHLDVDAGHLPGKGAQGAHIHAHAAAIHQDTLHLPSAGQTMLDDQVQAPILPRAPDKARVAPQRSACAVQVQIFHRSL
jgi:hypothetical protein